MKIKIPNVNMKIMQPTTADFPSPPPNSAQSTEKLNLPRK